jgi:hypothetical protein
MSIASHTPHEIELGYRGRRLVVACSHPGPTAWLAEFLLPSLRPDPSARVLNRITLRIDPDRYARLLAGKPAEASRIDCFTLDGQMEAHPWWDDPSYGPLIHHERGQAIMRLDALGDEVEMIASADQGRTRVALMRVVRELATLAARESGDLFLHASAAAAGGRAVIFAGPKCSGKTSMLLNALSRRAAFVSNDRVFLDAEGTVRGMPTIVALRSRPLPAGYRHTSTLEECRIAGAEPKSGGTGIGSLSALQLCRWIGCEAMPSATLTAIVFPRVDANVRSFALAPLRGKAAIDRWVEGLFTGKAQEACPRAFVGFAHGALPDHEAAAARCAELAGRIDCLELRIGPSAFGEPNVWDELVDRLSAAC